MFNTRRLHRLLTIPALLVAIAVLFAGPHPLLALAMFPPMVAIPFQLRAAHRPTSAAVATALTATRVMGYLGIAWGVLALVAAPAVGLFVVPAFIGLLVTAGSTTSERRLAGVMMIEGLLLAVAGLPLLWVGASYLVAIPAGVTLFAGATWWLAEATRAPEFVHDEAELPVAIAV